MERFNVNCLVIALFSICLSFVGQAQNTIQASSFGIKSNSFENASQGIKRAIAFCKDKPNVTLVLPGGRIDLWPEGAYKRELYISNTTEDDTLSKVKNIGFLFEDFKNLTLEGNNTLIVLHGKMVSFAILNSQNVQLRNIRFDYERPTMSELTINSIAPKVIETVIHPDSKYRIDNGTIVFYGEGWKNKVQHTVLFDPERETMRYSTLKPLLEGKAVETSPFHVRFEGDFSKLNYRTNDVLTFRDTYRDNCGGFINGSKNIKLEDVKMYFMHGLGIVSQFSENITLSKVVVAPQENSGRIISSFADCFHFSGCKGKIVIDGCSTSGSHDDPINVHGTHLKVIAIAKDKKVTVRFMHHQTYGFEAFFAKDSIAFVNPQTLKPIAYAKLKTAKLINKREMQLELDGALSDKVKVGDIIENSSWTPEVTIRNSRFERTNTRGMLLTTSRKVLVENNTFYRTGMHAILIADDASSWFESGAVRDVTIRNNTFQECSGTVINIAPENHELVDGFYVHHNIKIENNIFNVFDSSIVSARSTDGLIFSNNVINKSAVFPMTSNDNVISLTACKNVVVMKNKFNTIWKPKITLDKMTKKELKSDIKNIQ